MTKMSQKMELKQKLTPQQILQANLLQLNLPLLEQRILHELEVNPALELVDVSNNDLIDANIEENEADEEIDYEWEEFDNETDHYENPKIQARGMEDYEKPIVSSVTFTELILKQLEDESLSKQELKISEQILGNLDEQGYLNIDISLISDRMQISNQDVIDVMFKIQRLDPPGLAARNIQECLLVQAEVRDENSIAITILKNYFDDFVNHRYEKIIENISCSKEELNEAMEFIARLNPSPKDEQVYINSEVIIPDISIEDQGGDFQVVVQDGSMPDIRVSKTYVDMLTEHGEKKDVKKFIKNKLDSAVWFVDAIDQRKNTIKEVMLSIIKFQKNYFYSDKRKLKPMKLQDIADDIGRDISTISRVTNGKYVQLPWEIKELKTFFSEGVDTDSGEIVSNVEVKKRLADLIELEDKLNPISDQELSSILISEGYKIARRTVAKYREQLKYPTARLRRKIK